MMLEQISQELEKCLQNIYKLDENIELNIRNVLSTHGLEPFKNIECQEFNYLNTEYIRVDIYIKSMGAMTNIRIAVVIDKNEAIRKLRKEKLKKLDYE